MIQFESKLSNIKDIEARNLVFNSMEKEDQRKEIAWDAFQLLFNRRIYAADGEYWSDHLTDLDIKDRKLFQLELNENLPQCGVCARGAMMLSQIRLGNELSCNVDGSKCGTQKNIKGFTISRFEEMECEYEGWPCTRWNKYRNAGKDKHWQDHPYASDTNEKLMNMLLNILVNGDWNKYDYTDYLKDYKPKRKQKTS